MEFSAKALRAFKTETAALSAGREIAVLADNERRSSVVWYDGEGAARRFLVRAYATGEAGPVKVVDGKPYSFTRVWACIRIPKASAPGAQVGEGIESEE